MKKVLVCFILSFLVLFPALAEIPEQMNVQGVLKESASGKPINGVEKVSFVFFSDAAGNKSIKGQDDKANSGIEVSFVDGFFSQPVSTRGMNFSQPVYLKIILDARDTEFIQPVLSAPCSITAKNGVPGFRVLPADVTTLTPTVGAMCLDSTSNKLMYYDNTQWIQIDPVYTTKTIDMTEHKFYDGVTNSGQPSDLTYNSISGPFIITGFTGTVYTFLNPQIYQKYFDVTISVGSNSNVIKQRIYLSQTDLRRTFSIELPIPAKFNSGAPKISVTPSPGIQSSYKWEMSLQYIKLPL